MSFKITIWLIQRVVSQHIYILKYVYSYFITVNNEFNGWIFNNLLHCKDHYTLVHGNQLYAPLWRVKLAKTIGIADVGQQWSC